MKTESNKKNKRSSPFQISDVLVYCGFIFRFFVSITVICKAILRLLCNLFLYAKHLVHKGLLLATAQPPSQSYMDQ